MTRPDLERLGHARDDQRLAHRLAVADRQRDVLVGLIGKRGGDEHLAGDAFEGTKDAGVYNAVAPQLHDESHHLRRGLRLASGHAKSFASAVSAGTLVKSRKIGVTDTAP